MFSPSLTISRGGKKSGRAATSGLDRVQQSGVFGLQTTAGGRSDKSESAVELHGISGIRTDGTCLISVVGELVEPVFGVQSRSIPVEKDVPPSGNEITEAIG